MDKIFASVGLRSAFRNYAENKTAVLHNILMVLGRNESIKYQKGCRA